MNNIVSMLIGEADQDSGETMDFESFLKRAGVIVTMDDFIWTNHDVRFGRWSTGNHRYDVYYKRLLYKGKPVYLGSVTGCHDYNRTGSTSAAHFYVSVPSRKWEYNPKNRKTGKPVLRNPRMRKNYGYGNVHFKDPGSEWCEVDGLFDGCKYLLSLLKVQSPLKPAGDI